MQIEAERITLGSRVLPPTAPGRAPRYELSVAYVHSTNGGKLLLGRARERAEESFGAWFDAEGTLDEDAFDAWLAALVARAMGAAAAGDAAK